MRVHIDTDPLTQRCKVYLYQHDAIAGKTRIARNVGDGLFQMEEYDYGEKIDTPTFEVPEEFLSALRDALSNHGPFTENTVDWLRDAIKTRDRLLTLVENTVNK